MATDAEIFAWIADYEAEHGATFDMVEFGEEGHRLFGSEFDRAYLRYCRQATRDE